jgi:hypothetical protein
LEIREGLRDGDGWTQYSRSPEYEADLLVLLPLTSSYRRRYHAESVGNAAATVRGRIQIGPAASGSSRRPPEVGRWDRLKRAIDEGRPAFGRGRAIPRRIRRERNRPRHRRLCGIPTAERHPLWFKNSLRGPGLGKCCDAPEKEAMRCTAWAVFLWAKPLLAAWVASNSDGLCVSIRTPYLGWSLKPSGAT